MIVPFFPPASGGGVYRPLGFVKYLGKFGWRATVVTPRPESSWIHDETLVGDVPDDCDVVRTPAFSGQYVLSHLRRRRPRGGPAQVRSSTVFAGLRRAGSFFLLPDTYIGWYPFATMAGRRLIAQRRFDAIYSTSPPETSHLVARTLHRNTRIPWVADFRDAWMNLHLLRTPTPFHSMVHHRLERAVCESATVIVTSRWHRELLEKAYPRLRQVETITNGYDREKIRDVDHVQPARGRFRILHAGMLTQKRSAITFFQGLRIFFESKPEARSRCRVIFVGPRESANEAAVREFGLDGVAEFRDTVSHAESLRLERRAHVLLLIKHSDPAYLGTVPGKLYEYIGVRRPILALVPSVEAGETGEAGQTVLQLRRGELAPLGDPVEIAGAVGRLYDKYVAGTLDRHYDLSEVSRYNRERLTKQFVGCLEQVVSSGT